MTAPDTSEPIVLHGDLLVQSPPDQRAPDQDAAIEDAFVAGTLPEEDRRAELPTDTLGPMLVIQQVNGQWRVTSTFRDGAVTESEWADVRHAQLNAEPWIRANV